MSRKAYINKASSHRAVPTVGTIPEKNAASEYPLFLATTIAVALPLSMAYQQPPAAAFYSQTTALAAWSLVVLLAALLGLRGRNNSALAPYRIALLALWGVLTLVAVAHAAGGLSPGFVVAPIILNIAVCAAITLAAYALAHDGALMRRWFAAAALGLLIAALWNALAALVQFVAPGWTDDAWIASVAPPYVRASGNLRQPNQLATLTVWGLLAATWLCWRFKPLWLALTAPLLATLFATGSRTGVASLVLIIAAALLRSKRLRTWRWRGWLALLLVLLLLGGLAETVFTRATASAALSQRLALWHDVMVLIRDSPWFGVGFGQLNFGWTLTPLTARAPDVFDHAHSLPLHLAAELGIPVALLVLGLIAYALFAARTALKSRAGMTVFLLLATMLLHSLFEYPLWFSYFLLPTAFLFAWLVCAAPLHAHEAESTTPALRKVPASIRPASTQGTRAFTFTLIAMATAMGALAACAYAGREYAKAAAIHRNAPSAAALNTTVEIARASPLYGHFGDYAAIMLAGDRAPLALFTRPIRHVLDERLLAAYARALARSDRVEDQQRAAFVIARIREFPAHPLFDQLPALSASAAASSPAQAAVTVDSFRHQRDAAR